MRSWKDENGVIESYHQQEENSLDMIGQSETEWKSERE